jgi:cation:H+ antiporter
MFILAAVTSLPELSVDLEALRLNSPNLAVGDLFGSCLFNLMILAIADLIHKRSEGLFSYSSKYHAIAAIVSINIVTITSFILMIEKYFKLYTIGHISILSFLILGAYFLGLRIIYKNQKKLMMLDKKKSEIKLVENYLGRARAIVGFILCAICIFLIAPFLSQSAKKMAMEFGVSETFVGTSLIALSTSFPELVTTLAAVRMRSFDLAIGNIFGSNALNMLLIFVLDFFDKPSLLSQVSMSHLFTAFGVIMATSVAAIGQLNQIEGKWKFFEADAWSVLIISMLSYVAVFFSR